MRSTGRDDWEDVAVKVIALAAAHVESAADVLADLHGLPSDAGLISSLGDRKNAREAVGSVIGSGPGVVAVDDSGVVGFMVAPLPHVPGSSTARLRAGHHAVRPSQARLAYRQMYQALAARLVSAGCTYHSLPVPANMPAALETFFELEFGIDQVHGTVPVGKPGDSSATAVTDVRVATRDDIEELLQLAIELTKFHSRPPMFQPALLDVSGIRHSLIRSIEDDASTVLVIDDGQQLVAMMQAQPDSAYADSVVIGMNVVTEAARSAGMGTAMLDAMLGWAAHRAYQHCTVGWNIVQSDQRPLLPDAWLHTDSIPAAPAHRSPRRLGKRQPRLRHLRIAITPHAHHGNVRASPDPAAIPSPPAANCRAADRGPARVRRWG